MTKKYDLPAAFPRTYSGIIRAAVCDLEKVLADEKMCVDMVDWYEPERWTGRCEVCLGGAVLVKSGGFGLNDMYFDIFSNSFLVNRGSFFLKAVMRALNRLRLNEVSNFMGLLRDHVTTSVRFADLPVEIRRHNIQEFRYTDEGALFIRQLLDLADKFEKIKL